MENDRSAYFKKYQSRPDVAEKRRKQASDRYRRNAAIPERRKKIFEVHYHYVKSRRSSDEEFRRTLLDASKSSYSKLREEVMSGYGNKCCCCGESIREFLTIDHVNGGGRAERRTRSYYGWLKDIIREGFPDRYRVMCMNCNWGRRFSPDGKCPHAKVL